MSTPVQETIEVRVARRQAEAEGICSFELVRADGGALPAFTAGSHVELHIPGGAVRPYSLANSPADRQRYVIGVLREPASRGGSVALHEQVQEGDLLAIGQPRNLFPLAEGASSHLLLAGGIGITPMLSMAEHLLATGADFRLHYAARSPAHAAFLERLSAAPLAGHVRCHFGGQGQRLDIAEALGKPRPGVHVYACGPKRFMDAVAEAAQQLGWPAAQLHREVFQAEVVDSSGDAPFEVQLAQSGRSVTVAPGTSIVQALAAIGVSVMTSCEQGICGTCLTNVLDGTPDHRDQYLTDEERAEGKQILPCCSRSKSARLVLDL